MNPEDLPVVRLVRRFGADDRVFDGLLLLGPVVLVSLAVLGRSPATVALAAAYVLALPLYVLYKGYDRGRQDRQ